MRRHLRPGFPRMSCLRRWGLTAAAAGGLATASALLSPATAQGAEPPPPRKPNIVLLLADDLGYADIGFQGCKDVPTPNIDSIAVNGVIFTNGYVSCPICAPSRAGLMTGRYQQRFGFEHNPGPEAAAAKNWLLAVSCG
jgi:hypothetical protein